MQFPYFGFYPQDWLQDAHNRKLTREERDVHLHLLCLLWDEPECRLAEDDVVIARMLGESVGKWRRWKKVLVDGPYPVLHRDDGYLFSPRLLKERQKVLRLSRRGKTAADRRWTRHADAQASDKHMLEHPTSIPEASDKQDDKHMLTRTRSRDPEKDPEQKDPPAPAERGSVSHPYSSDFERFWAAYPRHIEKRAAWKVWQTRLRDGVAPLPLIAAAEHYARHCQHEQTAARYVKYPATFLGPTRPYEEWVIGSPSPAATPRGHPDPVMERLRQRHAAAVHQVPSPEEEEGP